MNERIIIEVAADGADSGTIHDLIGAISAEDIDGIISITLKGDSEDKSEFEYDVTYMIDTYLHKAAQHIEALRRARKQWEV